MILYNNFGEMIILFVISFTTCGHSPPIKVLLDFINAAMIIADMKIVKAVEILNPFNLKKHYND